MPTPLHMMLALHYATIDRPYAEADHDHATSPAVQRFTAELVRRGLLKPDAAMASGYRATAGLRAYLERLRAVPFPESKLARSWTFPDGWESGRALSDDDSHFAKTETQSERHTVWGADTVKFIDDQDVVGEQTKKENGPDYAKLAEEWRTGPAIVIERARQEAAAAERLDAAFWTRRAVELARNTERERCAEIADVEAREFERRRIELNKSPGNDVLHAVLGKTIARLITAQNIAALIRKGDPPYDDTAERNKGINTETDKKVGSVIMWRDHRLGKCMLGDTCECGAATRDADNGFNRRRMLACTHFNLDIRAGHILTDLFREIAQFDAEYAARNSDKPAAGATKYVSSTDGHCDTYEVPPEKVYPQPAPMCHGHNDPNSVALQNAKCSPVVVPEDATPEAIMRKVVERIAAIPNNAMPPKLFNAVTWAREVLRVLSGTTLDRVKWAQEMRDAM